MKSLIILSLLGFSAIGAPVEGESRQICNVQTSFPHSVSGNRCWSYDEVMVGLDSVDPMRIRCARLNVTCTRAPEESPEKAVESDGDAR